MPQMIVSPIFFQQTFSRSWYFVKIREAFKQLLLLLLVISMMQIQTSIAPNPVITFSPERVPAAGAVVTMECNIEVHDWDDFNYVAWEKGQETIMVYYGKDRGFVSGDHIGPFIVDYSFHGYRESRSVFSLAYNMSKCRKKQDIVGKYKCIIGTKKFRYFDTEKELDFDELEASIHYKDQIIANREKLELDADDNEKKIFIKTSGCILKPIIFVNDTMELIQVNVNTEPAEGCTYNVSTHFMYPSNQSGWVSVNIENCEEQYIQWIFGVIVHDEPSAKSSSTLYIVIAVCLVCLFMVLVVFVIKKKVMDKHPLTLRCINNKYLYCDSESCFCDDYHDEDKPEQSNDVWEVIVAKAMPIYENIQWVQV